jgi:two-component system, OmpR family, alkaline phosphatase synthesis response regulator PhoP
MNTPDVATILIVDDEQDIRELVSHNLEQAGFQTACVANGEDAIAKTRELQPQLVVLDLMLPGINGLDVCRVLKGDPDTAGVPILMLTARGEEEDIIKGLETGADDYLVKPFSPRVLVARAKAILRRHQVEEQPPDNLIVIDDLEIKPRHREVRVAGQLITMTFSEYQILYLLASHAGWVYTRNQIIDAVHGEDYPVTDRSVDVQVVGMRRKLGDTGNRIVAVRGVGYRFLEKE